MVALLTENFETGPSGATLNPTNCKASTVVLGTGNQQIFSPDFPIDPELLGLKVILGATNASLSEFQFGAQTGRVVVRIERFRFLTAGASFRPICFRNITPANAGHLFVGSSGNLSLINAAGGAVAGSTSTATLAAATDYDLEVAVTKGTTTSNGVIEYRLYPYQSATPTETKAITGQNTDVANLLSVRLGSSAAASAAQTWWGDSLQVQQLASGWIGPTVAPPVLTTAMTTDKAVIDARGSTAGAGGALTYTISPLTGVSEPVDGLFLVPRGVVYTVTVTETSGLSDSTPTVSVPTDAGSTGYSILTWDGTSWG